MPKSVLTRKRSLIARIAVFAMIFSLMAVALPASATSVALDTTSSCPTSTPSAGFTDIGAFDTTTQTAINCLFAFGITTGTSATTYSPNDTITRWQMALFLIRQAADHGIVIPAAVNQGYTDIGGFDTATQNAINQITQLGISKGTSTTTFSPNDGVTRWQMALFIYRTGQAANVTFSNSPTHNEFVDIATLSAEAQIAINALADTRPDPEGHIALGTGLSLFSPNLVLVRWQMALFLTRLLAADNVAAPAGVRVTVTPTDTVTQGVGTARAYTATFKNLDGTPYTGAVGITLKNVVSGVVQYDNVPVPGAVFETPSDGLVVFAGPTPTIQGFPGTNGIVTFVVRDVAGPTESIVPVAWEDLNNDDDPELTTASNNIPAEPFGVGGTTTFSAAPIAEAVAGVHVVDVISVNAANDSFVGNPVAAVTCGNGVGLDCTFSYDSGDLFLVGGVPVIDLATFEAALNAGDVVTTTYDPDTADQSTFDISTDNDPELTVVTPDTCGVEPCVSETVDAATFTITGTGVAGYTVAIHADVNDNEVIDGGEGKVGEATIAADGTWSVVVPLSQGIVNHFVANQRVLVGDPNGTPVNVPSISESAATAATILSTTSVNGGVANVLDVGDTIAINFSETVVAPDNGDLVEILEASGGTSVRLTCGPLGNATCTLVDSDTISLLVSASPVVLNAGDNGVVNTTGTIQVLGGFTGTDTQAVSVAGSPAANRTFTPF